MHRSLSESMPETCLHLFLLSGINRGTSVYLHILRMLDRQSQECRSVGFYHRNTSQTRKDEILFDLKLPLKSLSKKLKCVIATVSLGNKKATIQ